MSAYLIFDVDIPNPKRYEVYKRDVLKILARHGGEYLVKGGEFEVLEGDWQPVRLVLLRFPDRAAIHAYLNDPDYVPLRTLRNLLAKSHMIAVDGV